ncbi:MAG: heavy metal translocating P-type ATPase [Acidobacteriota bacterium]
MFDLTLSVCRDAVLHALGRLDPESPAPGCRRAGVDPAAGRIPLSAGDAQAIDEPRPDAGPPSPAAEAFLLALDQEDARLNRDLALSAAALGFTTVGALVSPAAILLGLPILVVQAVPYLREGYRSLVERRTIDGAVRDAAAVAGFLATGLLSMAALAEGAYALTKKIVLRTRRRSEDALTAAYGELPRTVWTVTPQGEEVEIPFEQLRPSHQVVVSAGQRVPADGHVVQGMATIDRRSLTGESQPVESGVGDAVFASTLVVSGRIVLRVETSGEDTTMGQIVQVLRATSHYPSSVELWSKRFSDRLALPTLAVSAAAMPLAGASGTLAVLISDPTWNARLTGPLSVLNYLRLATRQGILIKDGRALELLSKVDTVVFDKTGTLTLEQPEISRVHVCHGLDEDQVLRYAASAEARQQHPIARAILQAAEARGLDLRERRDAHYEEGFGILVDLGDERVQVGSARYVEAEGIRVPDQWRALLAAGQQQGHSYVFVAVNGRLAGMIELRPAIRPEVHRLVRQLKARNLTLCILSGDHEQVTAALAGQLGIAQYFAEVLPAGKAEIVERLQAGGASVCFVGDGINDAIALKTAHVSVSLHGASTVAADAASVVMMDGNLEKLPRLLEIADGLKANQKIDLLASILPSTLAIAGVFTLQFGVLPVFLITMAGDAVGITNAMLPRVLPHTAGEAAPPPPDSARTGRPVAQQEADASGRSEVTRAHRTEVS